MYSGTPPEWLALLSMQVLHTCTCTLYMCMNNITCFCIADSQTLRGCVCVHVAGHQTKALLNNSGPKVKRSKLEKDINTEVSFLPHRSNRYNVHVHIYMYMYVHI